jgi:PIN domain nuclease of toxin-antitoxin system
MRVLLDTHAFIWATTDDPRLSATARTIIEDPVTELLLSAASVYEMVWKAASGRLAMPDEPTVWVQTRMLAFGVGALSVTIEHAAAAAMLPPIHRDPWDRLLVAQAQREGIALVSNDRGIRQYDVEIIW